MRTLPKFSEILLIKFCDYFRICLNELKKFTNTQVCQRFTKMFASFHFIKTFRDVYFHSFTFEKKCMKLNIFQNS